MKALPGGIASNLSYATTVDRKFTAGLRRRIPEKCRYNMNARDAVETSTRSYLEDFVQTGLYILHRIQFHGFFNRVPFSPSLELNSGTWSIDISGWQLDLCTDTEIEADNGLVPW